MIKLPALPFYWQPLTKPAGNSLPDKLSFTLYYDPVWQLLRQKAAASLKAKLRSAYSTGSEISGLMDEQGIGRQYADDFLVFIKEVFPGTKLRGKNILEIGCGTGYLLSRLEKNDNRVLGLEPGFGQIGKYRIPVKREFFPAADLTRHTFDLVIGYALLEHLPDPGQFLRQIKTQLNGQGVLLLAVPDCTEQIRNGDISMLLHEHYSYFTIHSLRRVLTGSGFRILSLRRSDFGGCLYAAAVLSVKHSAKANQAGPIELKYIPAIRKNLSVLSDFLRQYKNKTIGIYVPLRALNALYLLKNDITEAGIILRFIDDSPHLHGKYLPGFRIRVENRKELLINPPDLVLIYSYTFGPKIEAGLKQALPPIVKIVKLNDIFVK
ncbi:MAG: class I SAM-dependent methyltransferase [bacterium]|nr:class I SAM-dependent methyltransferase [bacterium]